MTPTAAPPATRPHVLGAVAWPLATVAAVAGLFLWSYGDSLRGFFVLDDYWVMSAAAAIDVRSPRDLLAFLVPAQTFALYRPLSTVGYFYLLREAWGYDPFHYHATQVAAHVVNGLLAYAIAARLFGSRFAGFASALLYGCAPGHAMAVYWLATFTTTGTVLFYFLALWLWVALAGWARTAAVLGAFGLALLAGELAVTLPVALLLIEIVVHGRRDCGRVLREQALVLMVAAVYLGAKLYYHAMVLPRSGSPLALPVFEHAYGLTFVPASTVRLLGRYLGYSLDLLYVAAVEPSTAILLGAATLVVALAGTAAVTVGRFTAPPLRVAVFGLDLFVVGLGPLLFLPNHVYGYYVGVAAFGVALALVGCARGLEQSSRVATAVLVVTVLGVHVVWTAQRVREGDEIRFVHVGDAASGAWLNAVALATERAAVAWPVREVVLPSDPLTARLFGDAHRILLCATYNVRLVPAAELVTISRIPGRVVVGGPLPLPGRALPDGWRGALRPCAKQLPAQP